MMIFSHKGLAARKLSSAVTDFPHQIHGEHQRKYSGWADGDTPKFDGLSWFTNILSVLSSMLCSLLSSFSLYMIPYAIQPFSF
jgi:uncharacterized membrane-anchored protein